MQGQQTRKPPLGVIFDTSLDGDIDQIPALAMLCLGRARKRLCMTRESGCPICRASASRTWVEERAVFLVECDDCTTFTITPERLSTFHDAWRTGDREVLMYLELLSRYLRLGDDDCDREITDLTWKAFAAEAEQWGHRRG